MSKLTLDSIAAGYASTSLLNNNFTDIANEFQNKVLYRNNPTGEPNQMLNDLDMNSNDIININDVYADNVILNGVAIAASAVALPIASETIIGLVEKATTAEAQAATADKFPDAAGVKSYVDQFGIGVDNLTAVADLDTITKSGIYRSNNTTSNIPTDMSYATVIHGVRASGEMTQLATSVTGTTRIAIRSKVSGAWSAWQYLNPTVGTVSQSNGIPTGAIIEQGSNANGSYIKYADGTMICRGNISLGSVAITTATGSSFFTVTANTLTYAAAFASTPSVTVNIFSGTDTASVSRVAAGDNTVSLWFTRPTSGTATLVVGYVAIGRWY